jgi:glucosamine--fructose-6-phosphate aminotransferase (isomerizing)
MGPIEATHLYREIHEQPEVLRRLLDADREAADTLAAKIRQRAIRQVVIAARGTSDNAARYAKYLLSAANGLVVALATPSLYTIYHEPPQLGNCLVLGISQSGKSPDIVAVLAEAERQGALTAAITNDPDAELAQTAAHLLSLHAGEEQSIAATKTYTAELAAIALLSASLDPGTKHTQDLDLIPEKVAEALAVHGHMARIAERYRYMQSCVVIGRGYNYATAFELALKLKELTYTVVEPYSSADFMHGPLAMVDPGFPVIVIAPSGAMLADIRGFMHTVQERQAELIVVSDEEEALAMGRVALPLPPGIPEPLSPLVSIVPGQLFAMHLAYARDYDVDHPRGLHKVTETR